MPPLSLNDVPINLSDQNAVNIFTAYLDKNDAKNYPEVKEKMKSLLTIIIDTKKKSNDVNSKIDTQRSKISGIMQQIGSLKAKIDKLISEVPDIDGKDLDKLDNEIAEKIEALTKQLKNELDGIGKDADQVDKGLAGIESELAKIPTEKSKENEKSKMEGGKKRKTKKHSRKARKTKKGGYIWKFNKKANRTKRRDQKKKRRGLFNLGKTKSKLKTNQRSVTKTYN